MRIVAAALLSLCLFVSMPAVSFADEPIEAAGEPALAMTPADEAASSLTLQQVAIGTAVVGGAFAAGLIASGTLSTGLAAAGAVVLVYALLP